MVSYYRKKEAGAMRGRALMTRLTQKQKFTTDHTDGTDGTDGNKKRNRALRITFFSQAFGFVRVYLGAFFAAQKTGLSAPIPRACLRKPCGISASIPCAGLRDFRCNPGCMGEQRFCLAKS
jgi:hypothetical protein